MPPPAAPTQIFAARCEDLPYLIKAQLHPMIDATNESLEKAGIDDRPGTLLADAGYASEENFAAFAQTTPTATWPFAT